MEGQRIDKWLWCARLVRTRTPANALVTAGKIRVNGKRAPKPSRLVHAGDVVTGTRLGKLCGRGDPAARVRRYRPKSVRESHPAYCARRYGAGLIAWAPADQA
jgi:ribosomal protein S4